jgi:membrane fusion protein (multidrug efflux system)
MNAITLGYSGHLKGRMARIRANSKKHVLGLGASLAVIAAATYGYHWATVGRFVESTNDAYVGGDVTAIAPHVAGFVSEIDVSDNQHVAKGQLLMRLDDRDFRAARDHAEAALANKRAKLADLEAKYTAQQSAISEAGAELGAKEAQARFAHDDDVRYRGLERAVAVSRQDVQRAEAANQVALSTVAAAQATVAGANQQLQVIAADIAEAKADVAQAEADLKTAELNLGYTEIRAPVDGYVGNRAVRTGAYVPVGAYLASVIPAHGLWVDANLKEDQLARVKPGESATVVADVLPDREFHGRVESVAPGTGSVFSVIPPENATGNFTKIVQRVPVRIALDADDARLGGLRPGLSITASIDTRGSTP